MANQTPALVEQAKALGIDVDGRWGDDTIRQRIDAAIAAQADGADPVKNQVEALTDGEEDPATSGDAGSVAGVAPDGGGNAGSAGGGAGAEGSPREGSDAGSDEGNAEGGAVGGDVSGTGEGTAQAGEATEAPAGAPETGDDATDGRNGAETPEADAAPPADGASAPADHDAAAGEGDAEAASDREDDASDEDGDMDAAWEAMTAPMLAAFEAASAVYYVIRNDDGRQFGIDTGWMLGDTDGKIIVLVRHAAPFVRTYPDAPVEALYGQVASDGGKNLVLERPFETLPLPERLAWRVFRDTLLSIDREAAAERARALDAAERESRRVPIDETTLETIDDPLEASEIGGGRR